MNVARRGMDHDSAAIDWNRNDSEAFMTTRVAEKQPETRNLANQMEFELALEFARVVEDAAIASAHTMGTGDRERADHVATEAMRTTMDTVPMRGTIVIGEGERDQAPMLYIGEHVGAGWHDGEKSAGS